MLTTTKFKEKHKTTHMALLRVKESRPIALGTTQLGQCCCQRIPKRGIGNKWHWEQEPSWELTTGPRLLCLDPTFPGPH